MATIEKKRHHHHMYSDGDRKHRSMTFDLLAMCDLKPKMSRSIDIDHH